MTITNDKKEVIWQSVLDDLKVAMDDDMMFDTFFSSSTIHNVKNDTLTVLLPSKFAKQTLVSSDKYLELISECVKRITASNFNLEFKTIDELEVVTNYEAPVREEYVRFESNLNPNYTFENYVVGPSNKDAHSAALAVCVNPGKLYNPLFIFGKSGLGKTHMLHAVGNKIRMRDSSKRVLYISTDQFIEEYFDSIRSKGFDALKNKFKEIDVILIDDIQSLANKEKVSEYFFSIFNLFINNNKQIIITSDRPPLELRGLQDRLVSRFSQGLSLSLKEPEYETALKILKMKLRDKNYSEDLIGEDVLKFLAESFSSDVRKLEGALNKITFSVITSGLTNPLTLEDAMDSFKDVGLPKDTKTLTIENIKTTVSEYYNISKNELVSKLRTSKITLARHIAMYLCRSLLNVSLAQIGNEFGGRDHTTVMNGISKVDKMLKTNEDLIMAIKELTKRLES